MHIKTHAIAAIVMAALVAAVAPASAASTTLVVGSSHTTEDDFNDATELTNLTVSGTGTSASVSLSSNNKTVDDFEDGDIAEYSGTVGDGTVQTGTVYEGDYAFQFDPDGGLLSSSDGLPTYPSQGDLISYQTFHEGSGGGWFFSFGHQDENNYYNVRHGLSANTISIRKRVNGSVTTLAETTTGSPSGEWVRGEIDWGSDGTITYTVYDASGNVVASLSAQDSTFKSGGIGLNAWSHSAQYFDDIKTLRSEKVASGTYVSATHNVSNAKKAWADLTLQNATADVTVQAYGSSSWIDVANATISTTGNHTLDLEDTNYEQWRTKVVFDREEGETVAQLHDEGIKYEARAPEVDDDSASPDGTQVSDSSVDLTVDISDADFGASNDELLTVKWHLDGSQIDSTSLSRNATVSKSIDISGGGSHTWSVVVTDSAGLSTTSATYSFETPSQLEIRNESDPSQLVEQNVSVEIRVYDDEADTTRVYERTTSNGTVSLAGLPVDGFTAVAKADGYYFRRIYVKSLYNQKEIFLLPKSVAANYQIFTLDDRSGQYSPGQSRLEIQRALNQSGTLQWRTISGDQFGAANSYKTYLRDNKRYRLYVINQAGDRRLIGSYMSLDEVNPKQILVRDVRIDVPDGDSYYANAYVTDSDILTFAYRDLADQTDELRLTIHERGNSSNVLKETTIAPVNGNWTYSRSLSGENANTSWVVDWSVDRNGETHDGSIPVGVSGSMDVPIAGAWLQRFALLAIPIVAALASERIATYGALGAVAFAGMLMVFGWLQIHPMLWFAAATIAIGGHAWVISQRGGTVG